MPDEWLTTAQAAALLGFHVEAVRAMLRAGKLEARRFGPLWMVSARSVAKYKTRNAGRSKQDPRRE